MAISTKKVNQLGSGGTLAAGDKVVGEKVDGVTSLLTVGQLQPSDGDKGDLTVASSGTIWTIDNDVITYAKMQNVSATDRLLGRSTALAGDVEEIICTAAGRSLLDDANASAQRTTLELGTLATQSGTFSGTSSGTNTGDQTSIVGVTGTKAQFNTAVSDGDVLFTDGGTATGVYDFGGATSFELPNSASPTVDADGEMAVDTTVADFSHGIVKYFSGEEVGVVSMPIAQFTSPPNGYIVAYNSTADEFQLVVPPSGFDPNATAGTNNVIVGTTAGDSITSGGNFNVCVGYDAGTSITTSDNNVAVGYQALDAVTTASVNATAVGSGALGALTSGTGMAAVGYLAGSAQTTAAGGVFFGMQAGSANTGAANVCIGNTAMANGTASRNNNVVIGDNAGNFGTGSNSVVIGPGTTGRQHGSNCVYVGSTAGQNATGASNAVLGDSALSSGTGGAAADNVAIGAGAMIAGASGAIVFTSAAGNTCVGSRAGIDSATCLNAIAVGRDAVTTIATGATSSDNGPGIAIGSAAYKVGFRGDGTIYAAVGASAGYWRLKINGTVYKINLFADA